MIDLARVRESLKRYQEGMDLLAESVSKLKEAYQEQIRQQEAILDRLRKIGHPE